MRRVFPGGAQREAHISSMTQIKNVYKIKKNFSIRGDALLSLMKLVTPHKQEIDFLNLKQLPVCATLEFRRVKHSARRSRKVMMP